MTRSGSPESGSQVGGIRAKRAKASPAYPSIAIKILFARIWENQRGMHILGLVHAHQRQYLVGLSPIGAWSSKGAVMSPKDEESEKEKESICDSYIIFKPTRTRGGLTIR
ncbi:hypothetical protein CR513_41062, partial [Mucuna pruriens]